MSPGQADAACPACGRSEAAAIGTKCGYDIRRCAACRSLYSAVLDSSASEKYDDYYHEGNLEVPAIVHTRLADLVRRFARFRQTNRWLDVGCGAGALLDAATAAQWDVQGTEVAPVAAERLAARGLDVLAGELHELALTRGGYDVITLVEVLEHVAEPKALMGRVAELLRPGGIAYLTTPNARGVSARTLGLRWSLVAPPEHLQLFSHAGLRALVDQVDLMEREVRYEGVNPYELLAVLRPRRAPLVGGSRRVEAAYQLNTALHRRQAGVLFKSAVNGILNATHLGDGLKYEAVKPASRDSPAT